MTKTKKYLLFLSILSILCFSINVVTYAHSSDYWDGEYLTSATCNQNNLKFLVASSAITDYFTSSMYRAGTKWNGISDEVNVSVAIWVTGMPTTGFYSIYGGELEDPYMFAVTNTYDRNGNDTSVNNDWYYVGISMNTTNSKIVTGKGLTAAERAETAERTILHEIGHALKLCHPEINDNLAGHIYSDGFPLAIMNTGIPSLYEYVSTNIEQHDKDNLIAKWGA